MAAPTSHIPKEVRYGAQINAAQKRVVPMSFDEREAIFLDKFRRAADGDGIIIDCSRMEGSMDYTLFFDAAADGRLVHVDETIDGHRQVPFWRVTDKGRAWIAGVNR